MTFVIIAHCTATENFQVCKLGFPIAVQRIAFGPRFETLRGNLTQGQEF